MTKPNRLNSQRRKVELSLQRGPTSSLLNTNRRGPTAPESRSVELYANETTTQIFRFFRERITTGNRFNYPSSLSP